MYMLWVIVELFPRRQGYHRTKKKKKKKYTHDVPSRGSIRQLIVAKIANNGIVLTILLFRGSLL